MSTEATSDEKEEAYEELIQKVKRASTIGDAAGVLRWDQEVMMPEGGTPARSQQLSALSSIQHDLITDDRIGELLSKLEEKYLSEEQEAVVREVRWKHNRSTKVPRELVEEISKTSSEAHPVWKEAKENDEFEKFAPTLEKLIELKRDYAEHIDPNRDPYEVLFEDYEPYLGLDTAERVLKRLREGLVPLIDDIRSSDVDLATDTFEGTFDVDKQEELAREALDTLGYEWEHGRLDTAPHPFSSGTQFDARVTTRFDEGDALGALMSTIHEFGHATYTLGLPEEHYGTPLGESRNLVVHESQSRFWENHIGRSRAFWELFLPKAKEMFPQLEGATVEDAYEDANEVYEDNLIRVEADELTYHMHIVLRFELEKELIAGNMEVDEVPQAWNNRMEEFLGVRPDTDSEGCLQDIHWSHGSFGYFPTYSLGSVLSAQIYAAVEEELDDLEGDVRKGNFDDLHSWLTENIHKHGKRYTTDDLIAQATGEEFTADYFIDYVTEKYNRLYDL
ncbi:MAG: carboxypeptidase M32 [Halobacteria archaeon]|nr:carboxypeptidase M32 [Halobacteria archaeon]